MPTGQQVKQPHTGPGDPPAMTSLTPSLQCNKKARRSDIILLYAPKLKALDNTEQESLKK